MYNGQRGLAVIIDLKSDLFKICNVNHCNTVTTLTEDNKDIPVYQHSLQ